MFCDKPSVWTSTAAVWCSVEQRRRCKFFRERIHVGMHSDPISREIIWCCGKIERDKESQKEKRGRELENRGKPHVVGLCVNWPKFNCLVRLGVSVLISIQTTEPCWSVAEIDGETRERTILYNTCFLYCLGSWNFSVHSGTKDFLNDLLGLG